MRICAFPCKGWLSGALYQFMLQGEYSPVGHQRQQGEMYAKTTIRGYHRIRACARKSGMRPRVAGRYGLPFFLHRHKRRIGLLCGAAVAVLIVCILSSMIWTIDVQGNEAVSDTEILAVFEELGVRIGARRSKSMWRRCSAPQPGGSTILLGWH